MSKKRKPNSTNPRGEEWERGQMVSQAVSFAKDLAKIGVPGVYALEYVNTILATDIPRQCAACGALHHDVNALAYFQQAETNTTVLWARCQECSDRYAAADDENEDYADLDAATAERLVSWADKEVEPEGVVIIFNFAKAAPRPEPISIHDLAPEGDGYDE
jgi:hypothetical protein